MGPLDTGKTIQGFAGTAAVITYTINGAEVNTTTGISIFKELAQGQLAGSAATLYTAPASTSTIIKRIILANTTAVPVPITLYESGNAATNQTISVSIPASGEIIISDNGYQVYDSSGNIMTAVTSTSTGAISGWIDVTQASTPVLTTNSAATNVTNMNTILSNARNGSTIYIPGGIYLFNAAITMPQKMFTFQGQGSNRAGSPATAFTELQITANLATPFFAIASPNASLNYWYTTFNNIAFTAGIAQTTSSVIASQSNVGININNCSFQGTSSTFTLFNCIDFTSAAAGGEGGNSTIVYGCNFSQYTGTGVIVNSPFSAVNIIGCVIQGQWGTTSQCAVSGVTGSNVGALQISNSDILGSVNNLLLNPNNAASPVQVCASVFVTNVYFDAAFGSCIKITGTGATVRARFDTCSFTTSSATTALSAVELASTFAYAAGGQGIDFVNCNVLNTFATTGTTNGFLISGTADFSIGNCRIAGWTNGIQVTPIATAGRTQMQINNNTIGPAGGYGGNSVGILLNAGAAAYGSMVIESNILEGNTTPMTDNSTVGVTSIKSIGGNPGYMSSLGNLPPLSSGGAAVIAGRGAVTSGTAKTFLMTFRIPASSVSVGQVFRLTVWAVTSAAGIPTWEVAVGTAGTTADTTNLAVVQAAQAANVRQKLEAYVQVVALGASNTLVVNGAAMGGITSAGVWVGETVAAEVIASVATTGAWFITLSATCGTTGTITVQQAVLEAL